jgi:hypothetical protein
MGRKQVPPLRSPRIPVEVGGAGKLHAVFLNEDRTRGPVLRNVTGIRVRSGRDDKFVWGRVRKCNSLRSFIPPLTCHRQVGSSHGKPHGTPERSGAGGMTNLGVALPRSVVVRKCRTELPRNLTWTRLAKVLKVPTTPSTEFTPNRGLYKKRL